MGAGIVLHGVGVLDLTPKPPVQPIRLWDCGVAWKDVNPEKGTFVWDRLDQFASIPGKAVLVLGGTPAWAAQDPAQRSAPWIGPGSSSPPRILTDWEAYVRAVVKRYRGSFDYEIWNEPQLVDFWAPYSDIERLAQMTKRAHQIIVRGDVTARTIAASVLPRPSSGGMKRAMSYLRALKAVGWPCDVFSYHAYPEPDAGPHRFRAMTEAVQTSLRLLKAPKIPLWCTEVNYNLMNGPIDEDLIRPFMKATDRIAHNYGVARVYWYAYNHSDPMVLGIPLTPRSTGTKVLKTL